jgi:hypothetical protein
VGKLSLKKVKGRKKGRQILKESGTDQTSVEAIPGSGKEDDSTEV